MTQSQHGQINPHRARPVSPHLQIYRPMLTMMMSIAHRVSGVALYLGVVLLTVWLLAAALGPDAYNAVQKLVSGWFGTVVLILFTWTLMHHMLGGIRHFIWDTGRGFSRPAVEWLAQATLIGGILLTAIIWFSAFAIGFGT